MREESLLNSKEPTLSVFISNYNHGDRVGRAVGAIASQDRLPKELVVVDDGSTDNSVGVLRSLEKKYPWMRLIAAEKNRGVQVVLEEILPLLAGDYVYFGSSDDYVMPGFFKEAMLWAKKYSEAGMIFGEIVAVNEELERLYVVRVNNWAESLYADPEKYRRECLEGEVAGQSLVGSTVFKKSALDAVGGFRSELGSWCDSFAWRAIGLRYGVCYVAKPFMTWVVSPGSLSHRTSRRPGQMLRIVDRAVRLMRSNKFKSYFPEQHVRRWRRGYRIIILEQFLLSWLGDDLVMWLAKSKKLRNWRRQLWGVLSK